MTKERDLIVDHLRIALLQLVNGAADIAYCNIEQAIRDLGKLELKAPSASGVVLG